MELKSKAKEEVMIQQLKLVNLRLTRIGNGAAANTLFGKVKVMMTGCCSLCVQTFYKPFPQRHFHGPPTDPASCLTRLRGQPTFPVPEKARVVETEQRGHAGHVQRHR